MVGRFGWTNGNSLLLVGNLNPGREKLWPSSIYCPLEVGFFHEPQPITISRSTVDHTPLAGVLVGDIGRKAGLNGLDNGFIGFTHFRIPRENLLNKVADVTIDGTYTAEHIKPNKRFALLMNPLSSGTLPKVMTRGEKK